MTNHPQSVPPRSEIVQQNGRIYHLGLAPEELAPQLIVVGDPARAGLVSARFDRIDHEVRHREYVTYTGEYRGLPLSVIGTGIGADNVEIALVEAYVLNEFDLETAMRKKDAPKMTILRVGTSGGMRGDLEPGTLGIASYGLGLDNTGQFFEAPPADATTLELEEAAFDALNRATPSDRRFSRRVRPYASRATPAVVEAIERHARRLGTLNATGVTVTAPGFYGASGRFIDGLTNTIPEIKQALGAIELGDLRVINVEMESSLLFHLAAAMGYRAGTLCPIISSPGRHDVVVDYEKSIGEAIEVALGAMLELST